MTVYELIKELTQYDADAEIRFVAVGDMDFDTVAEFDRENDENMQKVTVNVRVDDVFEFKFINGYTRTSPKFIEMILEY